jgi:hypothetical protein
MYSYTIHTKGKNEGPFTLEQAKAGLADGTFAQGDLAWRPGLAAWAPLAQRLAEDTGEVPPLPGGAPALVHATPGKKPFNWLIPAILSTVFCCWPIGILAIVFAVKANSKQDSGDTTGAAKSRGLAQGFTIATLCLGLLIVPVGMMAALAIPAFKKVRNNAIEKTLINDARQISAAYNQICAEQAKETATVAELRPFLPQLSKSVRLGIAPTVAEGEIILLDYADPAADNTKLSRGGRFILTHEHYQRTLSTRHNIASQDAPEENGIVFEIDDGSVAK